MIHELKINTCNATGIRTSILRPFTEANQLDFEVSQYYAPGWENHADPPCTHQRRSLLHMHIEYQIECF